jgi:hypothetical protein
MFIPVYWTSVIETNTVHFFEAPGYYRILKNAV